VTGTSRAVATELQAKHPCHVCTSHASHCWGACQHVHICKQRLLTGPAPCHAALQGTLTPFYYWIGISRNGSAASYMHVDGTPLPQAASNEPYAHWAWYQTKSAASTGYDCVLAYSSYRYASFLGNASQASQCDPLQYASDPGNMDQTYGWGGYVCTARYNHVCQLPALAFPCLPPPSPSPPPPSPPSPPSPPLPDSCAPPSNTTFFCTADMCYSYFPVAATFTIARSVCSSAGESHDIVLPCTCSEAGLTAVTRVIPWCLLHTCRRRAAPALQQPGPAAGGAVPGGSGPAAQLLGRGQQAGWSLAVRSTQRQPSAPATRPRAICTLDMELQPAGGQRRPRLRAGVQLSCLRPVSAGAACCCQLPEVHDVHLLQAGCAV
jgi:hypothetical protein